MAETFTRAPGAPVLVRSYDQALEAAMQFLMEGVYDVDGVFEKGDYARGIAPALRLLNGLHSSGCPVVSALLEGQLRPEGAPTLSVVAA